MVGFSETQIKKYKEARDIYAILCYPTEFFMNTMIRIIVMNFPVTLEDIHNSVTVFVPDICDFKAKNDNKTNYSEEKYHKNTCKNFRIASFNHINNCCCCCFPDHRLVQCDQIMRWCCYNLGQGLL